MPNSNSTNNNGGSKKSRKSNNNGGGATAGANALLRQLLKTSTTLLLLSPSSVSEKELAKLLHGTIVPMLHDGRPKVRKAGWGCAMEIVMVASSSTGSNSSTGMGEEADTRQNETTTQLQLKIQQQRKGIADFLWEYCNAITTNYSPGKRVDKDTSSKLVHVLRFLAAALPFADDERIRVKFGEGCLVLMSGGGGGSGDGSGSKKGKKSVVADSTGGEVSMEVVRETLMTLLACLEFTEQEQATTIVGGTGKKSATEEGELPKFAARTLAFLLQHRPNSANSSYSSAGDVSVVYGRCLLACMERMMGDGGNNSINGNDVPASRLLATKLLPNVLTSMMHLCEAPSGSTDGGSDNAESCGSEFNQFISRMMPVITSFVTGDNDKLKRVALEVIPQCIPMVQQALQIQYRNAWGSILPGGYATFTSSLAMVLLELNALEDGGGAAENGDDVSELENNLQSWLKTLVLSLLRLRRDVEKDNTARTAVEYATSTVIRGMGVELFLSLVDFVDDDDDDDDEGKQSKKKSLPTTTGGGIRDDRAWLLPLMKQSTTSSSETSLSSLASSATVKTHLSFFQGRVLNLARRCDAASADGQRTAAEASIQRSRVVELWALFPTFCLHPLDVKENFAALAKTVVKALGDHSRYPKLIVSFLFGALV